jgi:hypothetical protein
MIQERQAKAFFSPKRRNEFRTFSKHPKTHWTRGAYMKPYSVLGILSVVSAIVLSCVAGACAATNAEAAISAAGLACLALLVGVRWVADKR